MSSNGHLPAKPAPQVGRTPWLVFVFLAAVFFFLQHELTYSKSAIDYFNPSENEITAAVAEGSLTRRITLLSLGLFAVVSLIRHKADRPLRIRGPLGWILLGFTVWAFASPLWAEDMALTLRRIVAFGIFCIAAVAIARRFSIRETILWTFLSSMLFLAIGVVAEAFLGTFRPFASGYRFAGTLHPNSQGINCALLILSGIAGAKIEKHKPANFRVCALLAFVFLVLTASRTAFAAAILSLFLYFALVCSRRAKIALAYALCVAFCFLSLVLGDTLLPDLKSAVLLGRDDSTIGSLNGRSGIWDDVGRYIVRRPILGYGYAGFWTPRHVSEISGEEKWGVPDSHSAYLEYLLGLGAVGLIAYVSALFAGIVRAIRFYSLSRDSVFAFLAAFLAFCAFDGLLESAVVEPSLLMFLNIVVLSQLAFVYRPEGKGTVNP